MRKPPMQARIPHDVLTARSRIRIEVLSGACVRTNVMLVGSHRLRNPSPRQVTLGRVTLRLPSMLARTRLPTNLPLKNLPLKNLNLCPW